MATPSHTCCRGCHKPGTACHTHGYKSPLPATTLARLQCVNPGFAAREVQVCAATVAFTAAIDGGANLPVLVCLSAALMVQILSDRIRRSHVRACHMWWLSCWQCSSSSEDEGPQAPLDMRACSLLCS